MRHIEDQEVIIHENRPEDLGGKRVVLARTEDGRRALWWRTAHHRVLRGVREYVPATLMLGDRTGKDGTHTTTTLILHRGGRITSLNLEVFARSIDDFFGAGTTANINLTQTLVLP